jgi:hypothetical protein
MKTTIFSSLLDLGWWTKTIKHSDILKVQPRIRFNLPAFPDSVFNCMFLCILATNLDDTNLEMVDICSKVESMCHTALYDRNNNFGKS